MSSKGLLAMTSLLATLYAVGTLTLAPISYGLVQARLTDALIALSFIPEIGWGAVLGVTLGNLIANIFSPFGLPDLLLGTLANFIASYTCLLFGRLKLKGSLLIGTFLASVEIAIIIGIGLLYLIYGVASPELSFLFILIGELISVTILGGLLTKAVMVTFRKRSF